MIRKYSLGREERLKSRKLVDELFASGTSVSVFPLRVFFAFLPVTSADDSYSKIGVTASRRNFKKAVDRNCIKRLLRESYRIQKHELRAVLANSGFKVHVFFIYVDKQLPAYQVVFNAMTKCLRVLEKRKPINESSS